MTSAPPRVKYTIRAAQPGDRAAILELLAELHPDAVEARYEWFYEQCPHGRALIWLAFADETQRPLGITSLVPRRMWIGDREVLGSFGGDSYVRPEARRCGMGQALLRAYGAQLAELGFSVMYGLPQPANRTPLSKLTTFDVEGGVGRYVRPLRTRGARLVSLFTRVVAARGEARLEAMLPEDPRVDEVWAQARPHLGVATVRDAAFYSWRFHRSVSQRQRPFVVMSGQRPIAVCALERSGTTLSIADLFGAPASLPLALEAIVAGADGCDRVDMRFMPAYARRGRVWRSGFFARSFKPLNILRPNGMPGAVAFADGPRWFITWADSDVDVTELA